MKMTACTCGVSATIILALGAVLLPAAAPAPQDPAPQAPASATAFQIDPVHSTSIFRVHHLGAGLFHGMFDNVTGTVQYDPENPEALSFDVVIDVESVHTGSHDMNTNLNNHLMSPDFFNAKEHPKMTFKSSSVKKTGEDVYEATGDLTIRGNTRTITANVRFTGMARSRGGARAGFLATFEIDRTDYEVSYMADSPMLGKNVQITVVIEGMSG